VNVLRLRLRPLTWLALVAILALALLPTLSHALAFVQGGSNWAEICTPQGAKRIALADDGSALTTTDINEDSRALGAMHLQHCPLCALSTDAPVLPPAAPAALPLAITSASPPAAFLHAPHTLHAWRSAQPRGPPPFS
jgi:Protein of unknown function (DUF2946)